MKSRTKWRTAGAVVIVVVLIGIVLAVSGCTRVVPVGWSGGAVANGVLFVGSTEGRLVKYQIEDQGRDWSDPLKISGQAGLFGCAPATSGGGCGGASSSVPIYGTPVISGEKVYIAGYNGKVYAYRIGDLGFLWDYPRDDYLDPIVGGLALSEGKIFFGTSGGAVYGLDAETGVELDSWQEPYLTEDKIWGTPVVEDGVLYIGSFDKNLYAINAENGTEIWHFTAEGAIIATPLVYGDTVYIGTFDRSLYALDKATGELKWQATGGNWFWAEPVVLDDIIYAPNLDGKVYALRPDTGAVVNEYEIGPVASRPVIVGDSIVLATREGLVIKLDTATGGTLQLADFETEINGPIAAFENIVYVHAPGLTLQRINVADGSILPSISLKSPE